MFCGSKQPPAAAPAAGAQAKTVMGWQATDLLKDMQQKGAVPAAGVAMLKPAGPPMGGPPPAAPPPMGPPMGGPPPAAPPPGAQAMGVAATLVPSSMPPGPAPMGGPGPMGGPSSMPPAGPPPGHGAQAKTMMVQGPPLGQGPGPMGGGAAQMPATLVPQTAPPAAAPHASQAATMFVQGPPLGQGPMGGPGGPGGPPPQGGYGGPPPPMGGPPPPMGGGYGGPPPPMGGPPPPMGGGYGGPPPPMGGGYGGPPPPMGGPPGGGPQGYNPQPVGGYQQPQGGYNPQPVGGYQQPGGPMNPPYLASRTAARVGAPVEPFKDGIKIVLIAFGLALLIAGAMPFTIEPKVTFRWDALSADGVPGLVKFQLIYVSAAAILALVFGLVPLATVPRGALTAVLGLVPIVLGLVTYLKDAKEIQWQVLVIFASTLTIVPGLMLRHEYRSQMLPRILATVGALCVLATMLVPVNGGDPPIVAAFQAIGDAPGKAKVGAILKIVPFGLAVATLLVWIPPPSSAGAKVIAWLWILNAVYTAYVLMLVAGHLGDAVKAKPNALLMEPWVFAAWSAFIGYGLATIFGKNLEHS
ncbi:MAG TPA: hypothetical protein VM261_27030 [Kofleriaceae bacterium]|nr:hypothetical protein [Kofleriaceae bacterium]